jgi:hypothetical protein
MEYTCNPSTQETEAGGLQVQGQPDLHIEAQFQNNRAGGVTQMAHHLPSKC